MTSGLSLAVDAVFVASQSQRRQVQWSPDNPLDELLLRTLRPHLNQRKPRRGGFTAIACTQSSEPWLGAEPGGRQ
jgi:hypothetical protein